MTAARRARPRETRRYCPTRNPTRFIPAYSSRAGLFVPKWGLAWYGVGQPGRRLQYAYCGCERSEACPEPAEGQSPCACQGWRTADNDDGRSGIAAATLRNAVLDSTAN